jgi:hypothetical protein
VIKARRDHLIVLGFSEENLERLKAGEPIAFDGASLGLRGFDFVILAGPSELAIAEMLEKRMGFTGISGGGGKPS